jgi:prevent-host-death family protein
VVTKENVMVRISVREAKAKLSSYIAMVENGEEVAILRRGRPVAILKSVDRAAELPPMEAFRKKIRMKGLSASDTIVRMREESRY